MQKIAWLNWPYWPNGQKGQNGHAKNCQHYLGKVRKVKKWEFWEISLFSKFSVQFFINRRYQKRNKLWGGCSFWRTKGNKWKGLSKGSESKMKKKHPRRSGKNVSDGRTSRMEERTVKKTNGQSKRRMGSQKTNGQSDCPTNWRWWGGHKIWKCFKMFAYIKKKVLPLQRKTK